MLLWQCHERNHLCVREHFTGLQGLGGEWYHSLPQEKPEENSASFLNNFQLKQIQGITVAISFLCKHFLPATVSIHHWWVCDMTNLVDETVPSYHPFKRIFEYLIRTWLLKSILHPLTLFYLTTCLQTEEERICSGSNTIGTTFRKGGGGV